MKQAEKQRLAALTRAAVARISGAHPQIKASAERAAAKYLPTNAEHYRELAEIVWWLIAVDRDTDAMPLLNTLCEVDDSLYWMFQALGSAFATRAWLHTKRKRRAAGRDDARTALVWIERDPMWKGIKKHEAQRALKRFDVWFDHAVRAKGTVEALRGLALALRVLVIYQQCAQAGDPNAKAVPSREYTSRLNSGVKELRHRIETW